MATKQWKKLGDLSDSELTPMLRQYLAAKAEAGDSLLFFRMGDFYELFFEDAVEAAGLLGITLTSRDAVNKDDRIPMAGVPVRAAGAYVARAIKAGRTVTICEQVEDPKSAKGVVKRDIVRTVTPGTVTEPDLLDDTVNNYLCAVLCREGRAGLAFLDLSTGEFLAAEAESAAESAVADELTRMAPAEVLLPGEPEPWLTALEQRFPHLCFRRIPAEAFDLEDARNALLRTFGLSTLKGVRLDDAPEALACAGAVLGYACDTQREGVPRLRLPRRYSPSRYVVLDGNTQRNLELVESMRDRRRQGTLLDVLDRTATAMGARKLRQWILHPLVDVEAIRRRLSGVSEFHGNVELRMRVRELLKGMGDLERLLSRLSSQRGNARDLQALGFALDRLPDLRAAVGECESPLLAELARGMDTLDDVAGWVRDAVADEPPVTLTDGNLIRDGYDAELDRLRDLVRGGRDWIATLQREEGERTGIPNLKVGYNKVFGYYIEITKAHTGRVPDHYDRKQTLVNAERYVTPQLKEREEEIVTAQDKMNTLEYELFTELRGRVSEQARRIQETADAIATADVLGSLAEVAGTKDYVCPQVDGEGAIHIRDGRHPVVEDLMPRGDFVPNDTHLDPDGAYLQVVTGPNMAGKSTYLRQVALITIMAQMGSFVPAAEARIGVVDRVFTRVGASDNLARGESTFMVEMIETAAILNSATQDSLLVLDEIGRGTSTFDGISIAWSVAEQIHDKIRAKTLFATHYHELTDLAGKLEHAKNLNVAVREWGGKVVFLYRIAEGGADHSYGIQVAKLAGLPPGVLERAREILESLESGNPASAGLPQQMYLFGPEAAAGPSQVEKELETVNPDELSPRQAQELLYHLKHLANKPRRSGK